MGYPVFYVPAGDVLPVFFDTYAGSTGASVTASGLAVTDIEIYKDGSTTQRASDAGYTLLDTDGLDFDSLTGIHGFSIDTGDNTDASFYTVGAWFTVVVSAITVDSQTVSFIACMFRIMAAEGVAGVPDVNVTHAADTAWASGAITAASIASDAITAAKIATGAIDADAIADNAIDAGAIAANAITAAKFAAGAIDAAAIAADAIGSSELAASAVTEIAAAIASPSINTTTIATLASQTSFTLTAGSADDNAYNGCMVVVTDASTAVQKAIGVVLDYTGSTKTVTLSEDPGIFTMAVGDAIEIRPDRSLKPTLMNRTVDVDADGGVEVDSIQTAGLAAIADAVLTRDWTSVTGIASRSLINAARVLRNKISISGGTLTVTEEDDTTSAWTAAVTTTAGDPISAIDPS